MDPFIELRSLVKGEVFDYQILMHVFRNYQKPRDKVTRALKNGSIVRIKQGLYAFGPPYRKGLISIEIVAAMLAQPSYISREYALQSYGFFSERVAMVTSMTTRKKKHFATPFGAFEYFSLNQKKFGIGVEAREVPDEGGYLFATKEKALADWIASVPRISDKKMLEFFLYEESRIEKSHLFPLDRNLLAQIAGVYHNHNVDLLLTL
jgi:hypothetical protein